MPTIVKIGDMPPASAIQGIDNFIINQSDGTKHLQANLIESDITPVTYTATSSGNITLSRAFGYSQKLIIVGNTTLMSPSGGVEGNNLKLYITSSGTNTLNFDGAIHLPTDSSVSLPKTLTSGLIYIVTLHKFSTFWGLQTLIGGY